MSNNFVKYIFIFLISATVLFSDTQSNYKQGLNFFAKKDYVSSYKAFEKALYNDISNSKISFFLGRSAYELGDFESAMIAFERVLILDETHLRSRLELARTYIMLNMSDRAKSELEKALKANPPSEVVENINKLLNFIKERKKHSFWNYYASLSIGYDENINANPGENIIKDYMANTFNLNRSAIITSDIIDATYSQEIINISNLYMFKDKNLFLESSFLVFAKQFNHYGEYNLLYSGLTSGFGTLYKGYKISLPLNYSKVYYGAKALLDSSHMQLKVEKKVLKDTSVKLAIKYQKKVYEDTTNRGRDTNVKEFELDVNQKIGLHIFRLSYIRSKEDKSNNTVQDYIDRNIDTYSINYTTNLYDVANLNLQYAYIKYMFDDNIPNSGKRVDIFRNYTLSLGKNINKSIAVILEYKYIENRSNYTPMSYDKNVYSINLNMSF